MELVEHNRTDFLSPQILFVIPECYYRESILNLALKKAMDSRFRGNDNPSYIFILASSFLRGELFVLLKHPLENVIDLVERMLEVEAVGDFVAAQIFADVLVVLQPFLEVA